MMIKLLPKDITKNWDTISYAIENSLPPIVGEVPGRMNRILESLLAGGLECWVGYVQEDDRVKIYSIGTSKILHDDSSNTKTFLMYSVFNFAPLEEKLWLEHFITLRKYAESRGCSRMTAYTDSPRMLELAHKFGGDTRYTFCSFPTNPL